MAQHGGVPVQDDEVPSRLQLSPPEHGKLIALDDFRSGDIRLGCEMMGYSSNLGIRYIPDYQPNPAEFHAAMERLVEDLRAEGN